MTRTLWSKWTLVHWVAAAFLGLGVALLVAGVLIPSSQVLFLGQVCLVLVVFLVVIGAILRRA